MRMVLLGPPGAGKGTQASAIAEHFGVPAISTGELFRAEADRGTPLGRRVALFMINSPTTGRGLAAATGSPRLQRRQTLA